MLDNNYTFKKPGAELHSLSVKCPRIIYDTFVQFRNNNNIPSNNDALLFLIASGLKSAGYLESDFEINLEAVNEWKRCSRGSA